MYCTNCGNKADGSSKFCEHCGQSLGGGAVDENKKMIFCTNCGNEMPENSAFCTNCGIPVNGEKAIPHSTGSTHQSTMVQKSNYVVKPQTKRKKRSFLKILVISVFVVVFLFILIALFSPDGVSNPDVIDLSDYNTDFVISNFSPASGSFGTIIAIEGENLDSKNIEGIYLNDIQIPLFNVTKNKIYAAVSSTITKGEYSLSVKYDKIENELGNFKVIDVKTDSVIEQKVDVSNDNIVKAGDFTVTIPSGVLSKSDTLTVERISTDIGSKFLEKSSEYYLVEIGDQHNFNGNINIEIPIPQEYVGNTPLVTYFNDEKGTWEPMQSEVSANGNLKITTSHLTPLGIVWGYDCIKSQDGFFSVYYDRDDTKINAHGNTNPVALANEVTLALVEARSRYDSVLGSAYKLKDGLTSQYVIVNSGYSEDGGSYSWKSSIIYLPGAYDTVENVKTTAAHELFHAYQDEYALGLTMGANLWWTEAMAEYASKKVAFGITPKIWTGSLPSETLTTVDTVHEYSMSAFIDYMINKNNVSFSDLHIAYINATSGGGLGSFTKAFYTDGSGSVALDFIEFWQMAFTNSSVVYTESPETMLSKITYVKEKPLTASVKVKIQNTDCQEVIGFAVTKQFDNVPVRYIKVYSPDADFDVVALQIQNDAPFSGQTATTVTDCIIKNMKPGGIKWESAIVPEVDKDYSIYEINNYDLLLLSILDTGTHTVEVKEVYPYADEKELKNIQVGDTTAIRYGFENIFKEAETLLVETDFGDGKIDSETFDARTRIGITVRHSYSTDTANSITGSLYDTTGGKKELIGRVVIPITLDLNFSLKASNNEPAVGETVTFELNVSDPAYTYVWNDGINEKTTSDSSIENIYSEAGNYTMKVTVLDGEGTQIGSASSNIQVADDSKGMIARSELLGVFNGGLVASWTESSGFTSKLIMTFEEVESHDGVYTFNSDGTCSFGYVNRENGTRTVYSTVYGKYKLIDEFVYKANQIDIIVRNQKLEKKDIKVATYQFYDAYSIDSEGNRRDDSFPWEQIQAIDGKYLTTAAYFGAFEKE